MESNYSVLMSVYYKEHSEYLRQSMQSIYDQTVPTDDFVLVCDGPLTPALDTVITDMQQTFCSRLHVIRLLKNGGLGNALNVGMQQCKNNLVAAWILMTLAVPTGVNASLPCSVTIQNSA